MNSIHGLILKPKVNSENSTLNQKCPMPSKCKSTLLLNSLNPTKEPVLLNPLKMLLKESMNKLITLKNLFPPLNPNKKFLKKLKKLLMKMISKLFLTIWIDLKLLLMKDKLLF